MLFVPSHCFSANLLSIDCAYTRSILNKGSTALKTKADDNDSNTITMTI